MNKTELYVVKIKKEERYLREHISKYGKTLSLSAEWVKAKYFDSIDAAKINAKSYILNQLKLTMNDLELVKVELVLNEKEIISL